MSTALIPQPDTIPVAWGWIQLLLLITFPIHLVFMNMMLGGLATAIVQQIRGGELERKFAKKIASAIPLIIAFTVNVGVAPFLFLQTLYGQFLYTSSILMGITWILVIPILILGYYGAYYYAFRFSHQEKTKPVIASLVLLLLLYVAFSLSNNMVLLNSPEHFMEYFSNRSGTMLATGNPSFWPRLLHIIVGAFAIGSLFTGLLVRYKATKDPALAPHAKRVALRGFLHLTLLNIGIGLWYLLSLPAEHRKLFMGGNIGASMFFIIGLLLTVGALVVARKKKYAATIGHAIALLFVMSFMRAWLRSSYLNEHFSLDQLKVDPQYAPMIFFFTILIIGLLCIWWLIKVTFQTIKKEAHD